MRMFAEVSAVYLHREPVDFRQSINGLPARVEGEMGLPVLSGAVFIFKGSEPFSQASPVSPAPLWYSAFVRSYP